MTRKSVMSSSTAAGPAERKSSVDCTNEASRSLIGGYEPPPARTTAQVYPTIGPMRTLGCSKELRSDVPHCRMQPETQLPRRSQGRCRTCEAGPGEFLASQVPCHIRNAVPVGRCRSAYRSAVFGHSDMESTMRYLKPSRSQHVRDKVERDLRLVVVRPGMQSGSELGGAGVRRSLI